jgi:CO/xanthine dehydrogenase FAD-binding subunit
VPTDKGPFLTFDPVGTRNKTADKLEELAPSERALDKEDSFSLSADAALKEAARCLNCGCYAVNPSDLTPVLIALGATLITNLREVTAEEFCTTKLKISEALQPGAIVERIEIPLTGSALAHYDKFRLRDSLDFAVASLASVFTVEGGVIAKAALVLGGLAPVPLRASAVEEFLQGKPVTEEVAEQAAELAAEGTLPLEYNAYKILELKALVKAAVLRAG